MMDGINDKEIETEILDLFKKYYVFTSLKYVLQDVNKSRLALSKDIIQIIKDHYAREKRPGELRRH